MGSCSSVVEDASKEESRGRRVDATFSNGNASDSSGRRGESEVTFDRPFSDYDPGVYTRQRTRALKRSPSIAALERVIHGREVQDRSGLDSPFSVSYSKKPPSAAKKRMSLASRTRRLSNVLNELSPHMDDLLACQENEDADSYLRRVFSLLDTERIQKVSQENLLRVFSKLRSKETLKVMFAVADGNHDGYLDWNEFSKFFRSGKEGECILAESADLEGALEAKMQQTIVKRRQSSSARHCRLHDVQVSNFPSQSERVKCIGLCPGLDIYAVSHRNDCTVHVYTFSGVEVRQLTGHSDSLLGIAFSPDAKYIATASRDWTMTLWDCTAGQELQCIRHNGVVTAIAFSFNGKMIYTGCQDNSLHKYTVPKARLKAVFREQPRREAGVIVTLATEQTKGDIIVFSRSVDKFACVANANNLSIIGQLGGHASIVWHARFNSDDSLILTCCEQKVIIWNRQSLATFASFDNRKVNPKMSASHWTTAAFGPNEFGNIFLVFNSSRVLYIINIDTGEVLIDLPFRAPVYAMSGGFNGNTVVCGDDYGNVYSIKLL